MILLLLFAVFSWGENFYLENTDDTTRTCLEDKPCGDFFKLSNVFTSESTVHLVGNEPILISGIARFNYSVSINGSDKELSPYYTNTTTTYIVSVIAFAMSNLTMNLSRMDEFDDHFLTISNNMTVSNCTITSGYNTITVYQSIIGVFLVEFVRWENVTFQGFITAMACNDSEVCGFSPIYLSNIQTSAFAVQHRISNIQATAPISFYSCIFQYCTSCGLGGVFHMDLEKVPDMKAEFYLCEFHFCSAAKGGSFLYLHVYDISQVQFPKLEDPSHVPRKNVTDPNDPSVVLQFDPYPYSYFGEKADNSTLIVEAGVHYDVPKMLSFPHGINDDTDAAKFFGQLVLIDIDTDITFPFDRQTAVLDGLIDNPYADIYLIGIRYNYQARDIDVFHTLSRLDTFSRVWLANPGYVEKYFMRYVGEKTLPSSSEDQAALALCETDPLRCCLAASTACVSFEKVSLNVDHDGFIVLLMPNGVVNSTVLIDHAVDVVAKDVSTAKPREELFFGSTQTTQARFHVGYSGIASFNDIRFVLKDVVEVISTDPGLQTLFHVKYLLYLYNCEFTKFPNSGDGLAAALADAASAGEPINNAYLVKLTKYTSLINAVEGSLILHRTAFENFTLSGGSDAQLIRVDYRALVHEAVSGGRRHYFVDILRCTFTNIFSNGDGGCLNLNLGKYRTASISESNFQSITSKKSGGVVYIVCDTLSSIRFPKSGKGFNVRYEGNGGFDCPGKPNACSPNANHDTFIGKTIAINLTDSTVRTPVPLSSSTSFAGLANYYLDLTESHVLGWEQDGGGLKAARFTLAQVLADVSLPVLECDLIDGVEEAEMCVFNGNEGEGKLCVVGENERGKVVCMDADSVNRKKDAAMWFGWRRMMMRGGEGEGAGIGMGKVLMVVMVVMLSALIV